MAEKFSFFNAEQNSAGEYDRTYLAEDIAAYFASFVGTGVYANSADNLMVFPMEGMNVQVKAGKGWIKGYYYENDSDLGLTLDNADGAQGRIDSIVLRLDLTNRYIKIFIKKGAYSANPTAPSLTRNADVWELQLATIAVNAGAAEITASDITDTRMNNSVCGVVKGVIEQIDTTSLFNQYDDKFNTWFEQIKDQLSGDVAGNLQAQITDIINGDIVPSSGINTYIHSKEGTVHNFQGEGSNGKALLTANFAAGDTITINGLSVTAYMGTEEAVSSMIGSEWNGKWISFTFDGETVNFKGGNGLNSKDKSKLIPENIKEGVTFFEGTPKEVKGTFKGTTTTVMSVSAGAGPKATATITSAIDVTDVDYVDVTCHCSSNGNNSEGYVSLGSIKYGKCSGYNGSWSGTQRFDVRSLTGSQNLVVYSWNYSSSGSVSSSLSKVVLVRE